MNIKVIVAGKCVLCGKPIELEDAKDTDKLPNIFFCQECEKKVNKNKSKAESEDKE